MQEFLLVLIVNGLSALWEYLSAHVLLCLVPAFFISGAFSALISKTSIIKYMGSSVGLRGKVIAYGFAAISGLVLEVCSCTILPLFAGIWKKGAGFGPAITFLFAGPGVTLLSTPLTATVIGPMFAVIKLALSIVIAVAVGVTMELVFRDTQGTLDQSQLVVDTEESDGRQRSRYQSGLFFTSLTMVMIFGTAPVDLVLKLVLVSISSVFTAAFAIAYYDRTEIKSWLSETYRFTKMIFPILLVGVFISGLIAPLIPPELIVALAGTNSLSGNLFAVLFGTIAYFPTLVEVPIAEMFLGLGMHPGPLMAYLIADPAVSIQTLLVINKIIRPARTVTYAALIIIFSIASGMVYGMFV